MSMLTRSDIYTPQGSLKILCLIQELAPFGSSQEPLFTLREEKEGFISLKRLFVDHTWDDPSEATFALEVFGDVGYWLKARESKALKVHLTEWREEADVYRKKEAFKAIINEVTSQGKSAFSAAKFLIDEPWKSSPSNPAPKGRPPKDTSKKTTLAASKEVKDDFERLQKFLQ